MDRLPDAEIVVIGAGAVGCGVAYSLAKAGKTDVLVLEKGEAIATETTAQAAGLVGQVRSSVDRVKLAMWSVKTFAEMEERWEAKPGWRQVGSLRVALTDERVAEFQRLQAVASEAGVEVISLDNQEASEHWPAMNFEQAKAVLWCPSDGYLQPYDVSMAYCVESRKLGVRYKTGVAVTGVVVENGRVTGVETDQGRVHCQKVVNAAGANAYQVAKSAGLELPIFPIRHHFFVTVRAEGMQPSLPVVRIPDISLYVRAETDAILAGGWETNMMDVDPRKFSIDQPPPRLEDDWDVMADFASRLSPFLPQVESLGIRSVFKGWPTFTPDGRFIIGESSKLKGFVMAGGCNAHGVSGSAGLGRHVTEAMLDAEPSDYVKSLSPDRFSSQDWDWATAVRDARQIFSNYYAIDH